MEEKRLTTKEKLDKAADIVEFLKDLNKDDQQEISLLVADALHPQSVIRIDFQYPRL